MRVFKFYIVLVLFFFGCNDTPTRNETVNIVKLKNDNCTVYLKKVIWGITGDNMATYVSMNDNLKDTINEPFFRALEFFYKLDENCDLLIYNADKIKDSNRHIEVNIIQEKVKGINYSNYKKKGFRSIIWD